MKEQKRLDAAYALGAYEIMRYVYEFSEKISESDALKRMIRNEYELTRSKLYDSIMEDEE